MSGKYKQIWHPKCDLCHGVWFNKNQLSINVLLLADLGVYKTHNKSDFNEIFKTVLKSWNSIKYRNFQYV